MSNMNEQPPSLYDPDRNEQLHNLWCSQMESVKDFRTHQLPLSRIKKIMKADRDVHMVAAEAPIFFAKACEMFIVDLTMRSWLHAEESKRRTLNKSDISAAASRAYAFDFLLDVLPRDDAAADAVFNPQPEAEVVPYYYPPGMVNGIPAADGTGMYVPRQQWPVAQVAPVAWPETAGGGEEEAEQGEGHSSVDLGA